MSDFIKEAEALGHRLHTDEHGRVDTSICDNGDHNGPGCERCGKSWCMHCGLSQLKPCSGERTVVHQVRRTVTRLQLDRAADDGVLLDAYFSEALAELYTKPIADIEIILMTKEIVKS